MVFEGTILPRRRRPSTRHLKWKIRSPRARPKRPNRIFMRALSGPPKKTKTKHYVNDQESRELHPADEIRCRPEIDFVKAVAKEVFLLLVRHMIEHWPQVVAWFQSLN